LPAAVLLKNVHDAAAGQGQRQRGGAKGLLPLDAATVGTVAVVGPHTAPFYGREMGYYYFGAHGCMPVCGTNATNQGPYYTVDDAFREHTEHVVAAAGVANCSSTDESGVAAAVAAAKAADTVVLAVGTDVTVAAEGKDAVDLTLSAPQQSLVAGVLAAARRKVVVLLTTAVPLDISDLLASDKVGAIVHMGVPGTQVRARPARFS
jgi:hypothetical protein